MTPDEVYQKVSQNVFYVRTAHPHKEKLRFGLRILMFFCKEGLTHSSANDGLIEIQNQLLNVEPRFGIDLGVLRADHIELVVGGIFSQSDRNHRTAFTRALLESIY